jgi:enoyl-CoA hydratase
MATRACDLVLGTLTVEQEDRVLTVRFCDPPHNYMTARMQKDLDTLTAAVDADVSVGAVVLTGGVPNRYITHFDIAEILTAAQRVGRPLSGQALLNLMRGVNVVGVVPGGDQVLERSPVSQFLSVTRFNEVVLRVMRSPAVYIAAIGGPCGGGGLEMSVCFDVRLAADDGAVQKGRPVRVPCAAAAVVGAPNLLGARGAQEFPGQPVSATVRLVVCVGAVSSPPLVTSS